MLSVSIPYEWYNISNYMKYKTIVDTNSVNNGGLGNKLFGNRSLLDELKDYIDLYVPDIVISEIKEHKRKSIIKQKSFLSQSDLAKIADVDLSGIYELDSNSLIDEDYKNEDYPFTIINIDNPEQFLIKFIPLAVRGEPPFNNDNDKGIKDALVAASVESLLGSCEDEMLILVSSDARLREYFQENKRIRLALNLSDLKNLFVHDDGKVETDETGAKRISFVGLRDKTPKQIAVERMILDFRNSPNFKRTHELISVLKKNYSLFELDDKVELIKAALDNNQIRWIIPDQDVYDFLMPIYFDCIDILDTRTKNIFESIINDSSDSPLGHYYSDFDDSIEPPF